MNNKDSKYLIVEYLGVELPIVFNPIIFHSTVATGQNIVAAGFCRFDKEAGGWRCWGRSQNLEINSRGEQDEQILNNDLGMNL